MGIETAILGGSIIGGGLGLLGAREQADAAQSGIDFSERQFNTILDLTQPQRDVSNAALNTLASAFIPGFAGISAGNQPNTPNIDPQLIRRLGLPLTESPPGVSRGTLEPVDANALSDIFRNLPGSEFAVNEAERAVGNSFASRGGAFSGDAIRALGDRVSNIASDRVFNSLFQLAGFGPGATNTASSAALSTGNSVASLLGAQGAARASGLGSVNNAVQGGLSNFLLLDALNSGGGVVNPAAVGPGFSPPIAPGFGNAVKGARFG